MRTITFKWSVNKNEYAKCFAIPTNKFARRLTSNEMRKHYNMLRRAVKSEMNDVDYSITHA